MRLLFACSIACLLSIASPARAVPIDAAASSGAPTTSSYVWNNGDSKAFELSWDGTTVFFTVEDLGTAAYRSVSECCEDTFDRVRVVYPGAALTFTHLAINTLPVNTVFVDNLDLSLLKQGALDNLGVLTGVVTLRWDDPFARMPLMQFDATPEGIADPLPAPEPATILLLGGGLAGGYLARRRRTTQQTS